MDLKVLYSIFSEQNLPRIKLQSVEFLTSNRLMCNWCCDALTEADMKAAEEAREKAKAKAVNPITRHDCISSGKI